jgi:hypothetical protein
MARVRQCNAKLLAAKENVTLEAERNGDAWREQ